MFIYVIYFEFGRFENNPWGMSFKKEKEKEKSQSIV